MADDTVIVIATDLVHQCVDFALDCWPRGAEPAQPLRFRLVAGEGLGFLVVDVGQSIDQLEAAQGSVPTGRRAPSPSVLPLSDLGVALERAAPEETRRAALIEAITLCLDRWRPCGHTPPFAGLRAAALAACEAAMPSRPRLAGTGVDVFGADAAHVSETSLEALFRTLHYCRLHAGARA